MFRLRSTALIAAVGLVVLLRGTTGFANTTFNTQSCPSGQTCLEAPNLTTGNTLQFSGGLSAEAFQITGGTIATSTNAGSPSLSDKLTPVLLGLYPAAGLGAGTQSSPANAVSNSPINGAYNDTMIVFQLPSNSAVVSVSLLTHNSLPNAVTLFVGSNSAFTSLSSFKNASLSTIENDFTEVNFANTDSTGSCGSGVGCTDTLSSPTNGSFLIIAGALTEPKGCTSTGNSNCDYFKVARIVTGPDPKVPEPSSLLLLLAGVGLYAAKRRRNSTEREAASR